jgi:hypothetical protein
MEESESRVETDVVTPADVCGESKRKAVCSTSTENTGFVDPTLSIFCERFYFTFKYLLVWQGSHRWL